LETRHFVFALAAVAAIAAGCNRRDKVPVGQTQEEAPRMATMLHVADPRADQQLLVGFHAVEQNSWRWTEQSFSVALRPPRDAAKNGVILQLKFSLPEVVSQKLGAVALEATVAGSPLGKESYTVPGELTYTREVPAKLLAGDSVRVDFDLDKSLPPNDSDQRNLGIIVSAVGFETK
jgi:hypothetical protein